MWATVGAWLLKTFGAKTLARIGGAIAVAVLVVAAFAGIWWMGYTSGAAGCKAERTAQVTVTKYVDRVVKVTDDSAIKQLKSELKSAKKTGASLARQLQEARDAAPTIALSMDCRLSDGLRDSINDALQSD